MWFAPYFHNQTENANGTDTTLDDANDNTMNDATDGTDTPTDKPTEKPTEDNGNTPDADELVAKINAYLASK